MKYMNEAKKFGSQVGAQCRRFAPVLIAGAIIAMPTLGLADPLLDGTTDPVTTKQADVEADYGVVAGVLLALAVVVFGIRKVLGLIR